MTFVNERVADGAKPATASNIAYVLKAFALSMKKKRVRAATREDVIRFINEAFTIDALQGKGERRVGASMQVLRKTILKQFFRWMRKSGPDEWPEEVRGIKLRVGQKHETMPLDAIYTPEVLQALHRACRSDQERARLLTLYESGARPSEFVALQRRSVAFDEYGALFLLPTHATGLKTGARRIRLFDGVAALQMWLEGHPSKDPNAPLWTNDHGAPLDYQGLWRWCRDLRDRAGLDRIVRPHLFRHTAATERARLGWNEAQMRAFFGWSADSEMPSRYVHLAGLDYETMELARRGLVGDGHKPSPAIRPTECRYCHAKNPFGAMFCRECSRPMTPEAEASIASHREKQTDLQRAIEETNMLRAELSKALDEVRFAMAAGVEGAMAFQAAGIEKTKGTPPVFANEKDPIPHSVGKVKDDEVERLAKKYSTRFPGDKAEVARSLLRENPGVGLRQLARIMNVPVSRVHAWKNGGRSREA